MAFNITKLTDQDAATKTYVDRLIPYPRKYKVLIVAGQSNTYYGREWGNSAAITTVKYMNRRIVQFGMTNGQSDALLPLSLRLEVNDTDNQTMSGYGAVLAGLLMQDAIGPNNLGIINSDEMLMVLPCMLGATGFSTNYWTPFGTGYRSLIRRIRYILTHYNAEFIGMTWSQGESDTLPVLNDNYRYILQNFVQAVRDCIAYSSKPFEPLTETQTVANKLPFVTFQMSPTWVAISVAATPVQNALANIGNVVPYTSTISMSGLPPPLRIANIDTIHYDSRQQLFLAQQFYNGLATAMVNTNANGNYTPSYTTGSTLLARHTMSPTTLFPANYHGAFNIPSATPTTAVLYSQLYNNWKYKNNNGYYKFRVSYKIGGVWKNIVFEQAFLPLMSMPYQNVAQLISTDTPFGNSNTGMGFAGLNIPSNTSLISTGSVLTLDASGSFWAPVCQNTLFAYQSVNVIPVYDNYILDNSSTIVAATEVELYAVRD